MQTVYEAIKQNPDYFAWLFGIANILWVAFIYFNKKRHDRELIELKQSLDLDSDKRRKIYEMKSIQYQAYFNNIDAFNRKHQSNYKELFLPIMNQFTERYLRANSENNEQAATDSVIWFSEKISNMTADGFEEFMKMQNETNAIKLIANEPVSRLLEELKGLHNKMFELSSEIMKKFVEITTQGNSEQYEQYQAEMASVGDLIQAKSEELRKEMKKDLENI